jgi:hypothetical protein
MKDESQKPAGERDTETKALIDAVAALGYHVQKIRYLVQPNGSDIQTARTTNLPYVRLSLSL